MNQVRAYAPTRQQNRVKKLHNLIKHMKNYENSEMHATKKTDEVIEDQLHFNFSPLRMLRVDML